MFKILIGWLLLAWKYFEEIAFPLGARIRRIETLDAEDFWLLASQGDCAPDVPDTISLFNYRDPVVRDAIWVLKYHGSRALARMFASILYDMIVEWISDEMMFANFGRPIVVPVPLSPGKLAERGWNQDEMVARELEVLDDGKIFSVRLDILEKVRETQSQTKLGREERVKNLTDCFGVRNATAVRGRNVILIDDVVTTGSTVREARAALLARGARRVVAFTLAH